MLKGEIVDMRRFLLVRLPSEPMLFLLIKKPVGFQITRFFSRKKEKMQTNLTE
jgi:hypothetical protein